MQINFYKNKSAPNVIPKNIKVEKVYECRLKESTTLSNPTILLKISAFDTLINCNYFYIPTFKRYYYIDEITINNALCEVSGSVDVLESFKTDILASNQIIARQERKANYSLIDDRLPICSDVAITTHLPDSTYDTFTTDSGFFILGTTGGAN